MTMYECFITMYDFVWLYQAPAFKIRKFPIFVKIAFIAPLVYIAYEKLFETFGVYFGALDGSQSAIMSIKPSQICVEVHVESDNNITYYRWTSAIYTLYFISG